MFSWIKSRLSHKVESFSCKKIKRFLKENGLAFVIIFIGWEIVEDIVFPIIFGFLGNYIHPAFYVGIPASIILCFHWLAIPILWGLYLKFKGEKGELIVEECCDKDA